MLRLMINEPWRTHGAGLTTRESEIQRLLADTVVPAPTSLALDADGSTAGHPAHLMSLLPGCVDLDRVGADDLGSWPTCSARSTRSSRPRPPRDYQSWAWPAKYVVPEWARHPAAWEQAFAVLGGDPPAYEPTFLHRDFHLRNVLWEDDRISGVVDWVETSWGPAWLDVAHCRTNLAIHHGTDVADRFAEAYVDRSRRAEPAAYWDVMDVVGFLPPPNRVAFVTGPTSERGSRTTWWRCWGCDRSGALPGVDARTRTAVRRRREPSADHSRVAEALAARVVPGVAGLAEVPADGARGHANTRATSSKSPPLRGQRGHVIVVQANAAGRSGTGRAACRTVQVVGPALVVGGRHRADDGVQVA